MVVVVEATHGAVLVVGHEDCHYLNNSPVQLRSIVSGRILPCREPNMTTIRTIATDDVASKLICCLCHAQAEMETNAPIILVENQ